MFRFVLIVSLLLLVLFFLPHVHHDRRLTVMFILCLCRMYLYNLFYREWVEFEGFGASPSTGKSEDDGPWMFPTPDDAAM